MDRSSKLFVILVLVGFAAAIALAVGKSRIERSNRAVEVIIDADDARLLSMSSGIPVAEVLRSLRNAGATALAVRETTVGELVALGSLVPVASPGAINLASADTELLSALAVAIHAKLPRAEIAISTSSVPALVFPGMAMDQLAKVPVLLRPDDLRAAREVDLRIVARLMNFPAASPDTIEAAAQEAKAAGARLIIFREDQVLGFPELLQSTADALDRSDLLYGYVEIVNQKGSDALASKTPARLIRVHSITDADMLATTPASGVERYERAVAERNIRACYLRLIVRPQPDAIGQNTRYVMSVVSAIRNRGFQTGPPTPFAAPPGWPPTWARALALLALPAAFVLLVRRLAPISAASAWAIFAVVIVLGLILVVVRRPMVVPVSGLAAACIFPSLALTWVLQYARGTHFRMPAGRLIGRAVLGLLVTCGITLVGALLIVGIYSPVRYLEGVGVFSGVKVAYLVPLLVAFLVAIVDAPGSAEPMRRWWARAKSTSTQFFGQPVTIILAIIVFAALGALAFAVSRSGNQPAVAPTGGELKLRSFLENILVVRPRTKEFLLGYPALMLAIALSLRSRRTWLPLLAVLAGIGQISLLNTFCHFHSPLLINLARTANGLWLGVLVGIVVVLVWRWLLDRRLQPIGQ